MDLLELQNKVIADGIVDAAEVTLIAETIYAEDGEAGAGVGRNEADMLFAINDAVSGKDNDAGWASLFVEAIGKHVLEDETTPGVVDVDESSYLIEKIGADGKIDPIELDLLVHVISTATQCTDELNKYALEALKASVLEDGVIDDAEVEKIGKLIYGTGSGDGEGISREEADFLFALNDATSGKENSNAWQPLFVEAISKHVLEDETTPGVVDADESEWLVSKVQADDKYDDNEIALFKNIKEKATSVDEKLTFQFDLMSL